jgi:hypothetical protein
MVAVLLAGVRRTTREFVHQDRCAPAHVFSSFSRLQNASFYPYPKLDTYAGYHERAPR